LAKSAPKALAFPSQEYQALCRLPSLSFFDMKPSIYLPTCERPADRRLFDDQTSRTSQSGIKNIGAIGCGNQNHAFVRFKTVHFHKKLIQCLLSFVMPAAQARSSMTPNRVNFIN